MQLTSISDDLKVLSGRVDALETKVDAIKKDLETKLRAQQAEIDALKKALPATQTP